MFLRLRCVRLPVSHAPEQGYDLLIQLFLISFDFPLNSTSRAPGLHVSDKVDPMIVFCFFDLGWFDIQVAGGSLPVMLCNMLRPIGPPPTIVCRVWAGVWFIFHDSRLSGARVDDNADFEGALSSVSAIVV